MNNDIYSINNFKELYQTIENNFFNKDSKLDNLYVSPEVFIAMVELEEKTDAIWVYEKDQVFYNEKKEGYLIEINVRNPEELKKFNYKDLISNAFFDRNIGVGNIKEDSLDYLNKQNRNIKM
jgi:hypothetical protein